MKNRGVARHISEMWRATWFRRCEVTNVPYRSQGGPLRGHHGLEQGGHGGHLAPGPRWCIKVYWGHGPEVRAPRAELSVYAAHKWEHLLRQAPFTVHLDNMLVANLTSCKDPGGTRRRWLEFLSRFEIQVFHVALGKERQCMSFLLSSPKLWS